MDIWEIKNSIDFKKSLDWEVAKSEYNSWVMNLAFSFNEITIVYANVMNQYSFIPTKWQYDFYYGVVSKGKKEGKWVKASKDNDKTVKLISEYYNINIKRAYEYSKLLTEEQIKTISDLMNKGGIKK